MDKKMPHIPGPSTDSVAESDDSLEDLNVLAKKWRSEGYVSSYDEFSADRRVFGYKEAKRECAAELERLKKSLESRMNNLENEIKKLEGILDDCNIIWRPEDVKRFNEIDSRPITEEERKNARKSLEAYRRLKSKITPSHLVEKWLTKA